jgi:hypothetical protein
MWPTLFFLSMTKNWALIVFFQKNEDNWPYSTAVYKGSSVIGDVLSRVETKIFVFVFSRNFFSLFAKKSYEKFRENFRFPESFRENFPFEMRIRIQEPLECVSRSEHWLMLP